MARLRIHGCNIDNILKTSDKKLGELIYPVGFWQVSIEYDFLIGVLPEIKYLAFLKFLIKFQGKEANIFWLFSSTHLFSVCVYWAYFTNF